jgi:adenine-specific DNA methylase
LVAVVVYRGRGREYRLANERDFEIFREAEEYLKEKREKLWDEWGFDPVPDEPTPLGKGRGAERAFSIRLYGLDSWGDLFNSRQKLALITFSEKLRQAYEEMEKEGMEEEYGKAVASYLALAISRMSDFLGSLCHWHNGWEMVPNTFNRQALPMIWDYGELNPISPILSGTFKSMLGQVLDALNFLLSIPPLEEDGLIPDVRQGSATELPYPDEYFDAVITDPPYYDNVPYAYLSDFFYVWLKRMLYDIHPELFSTPLTPKSKEIVAYTIGKTWEEAKKEFEEKLSLAFKEIQRVLKPDAPALIIYAHKSTSGWETLINALLDSGLLPTATLPIDTEQAKRLRAQESAALASSLFIACRKRERKGIGWLRDVREELRQYLPEKLKRLWDEGIRGADFLIAGIGVAIEVFGKYEIVMDAEGNVLGADKMLDMVRAMVADFALREALQDGIADKITPMTRFYLLWRHIYGNLPVIFDDAKKLAQSVGIDLAKEFNKGFIRKEKENIRLLPPTERREEELKESDELIDILHYALLLWRAGKREEMRQLISRNGSSEMNALEKVAQAIASALPTDNQERRLLEGFLASKEFIPREETRPAQKTLPYEGR